MKPELSKQELSSQRDRLRLLLDVNNAVTSHLDLQDLVSAISTSLRQAISLDSTGLGLGLALYDENIQQLKVHVNETFGPAQSFELCEPIPLKGNPAGVTYATGKSVLWKRAAIEEFDAPVFRRFVEAKELKSGISVPLKLQDQSVGVVSLSSVRDDAFSEKDVELLEQISGQLAIAVANAINFKAARRESDRKQLLLEINNAVASNLNIHDLLQAISSVLRDCVPHDYTGLAVYDEKIQQLRIHRVEATDTEGMLGEGETIPMEGTTAGLAFITRQIVRRDKLDFDEFDAPIFKVMIDALHIQSALVVPLIIEDRVIGVLSLTSRTEAAFSEEDAELLGQIGKQLAIAVENALNFQRAAFERDRRQLLLEVNNAVVSNLGLKDLLISVSGWLRERIKHDFASVVLIDDEGQLRIHALDKPPLEGLEGTIGEGSIMPMDGTPAGLAIRTRSTVRRDFIDFQEFDIPMIRLAYAAGLRSGMSVCLISHDEIFGTLNVGSLREGAFSQEDQELLEQIAGQVAIAVENAKNFERATKERARAEMLLEVNNACTTNLDLHDLLKATSECLRKYFKNDVTGLALYDPEVDQLRIHALDVAYEPDRYANEGVLMSLNETPAGRAFTTRRPVLLRKFDLTEFPSPIMERAVAAGLKSSCNAPLISHDRVLGSVAMASRREAAFNEADAEMLYHIARQLAIAVENALQYREIEALKNKLASEKLYLEEEIQTQYNFEEIIGQSVALKKILQQVATVAPTDSAVLLCGETGTGKELIARAIHNLSSRRERTLVKLNCAAIPTGLLESELFGHEKGAFTGAIAQRVGRFELANKGSLLLDEIGEIPLELQPKLLRVLQEHEFERLGSSRTIKTDARLIAATNVDLPQMVAEKKFRSDLFYRLNVFPIIIPPLRDRVGDIPLLIGYFAQKHSLRMNKRIDVVPKDTVDALCDYSWPGNVRELENFVERSVILSSGATLQAPLGELRAQSPTMVAIDGPAMSVAADGADAGQVSLEENERRHIARTLEQTKGVIGGKGGAAEILGLPISTLRNRMKKLGLK
jgi:formate hydrogenlyase transcriptional activator